jgi:hypothetical protein
VSTTAFYCPKFCGLSGKAGNLIKPYLQDRFQRELIDYDSRKYSSKWEPVKHGVFQGCIHGPLFFLIYILMIYLQSYLVYPTQFYLQMIQA